MHLQQAMHSHDFLPLSPHKIPHTVPIPVCTHPQTPWQATTWSPRHWQGIAVHCGAVSALNCASPHITHTCPHHSIHPHIALAVCPPISPTPLLLSLLPPSLPWPPLVRCHMRTHSACGTATMWSAAIIVQQWQALDSPVWAVLR